MPHAQTRDVSLYYEIVGAPEGAPLLLIAGQGGQLISWPAGFRDLLANAGYQVILFDNRDVGWSTKIDDGRSYDLADMADDAAALIEHLQVGPVHVVGQSMGGMIAQLLTIRHPHLVRSLCSIYSAPGPSHITTHPQVWNIREQPAATERNAAVLQYIERERLCGLDGYTEKEIRDYAEQTVDRCWYPEGGERQMNAVRRSEDRTEALRKVEVPTAVIHGLDDLLIDVSGSRVTAEAIPDAELHTYANMGHQLVPALWQDYVRVITRAADRADL